MAVKSDIYQKALDLLARREHSAVELKNKLITRFSEDFVIIEDIIEDLISKNYLSDQRYAEAILSYRSKKGYGLNWIRLFLKGKGVSSENVEKIFENSDIDWEQIISMVKIKKFGTNEPKNFKENARIMSFLQTRGFTKEQIDSLYQFE